MELHNNNDDIISEDGNDNKEEHSQNISLIFVTLLVSQASNPIISKEVSECIDQARKALVSSKNNYRLLKINGTAKQKNGNKSRFDLSKWKPLLDVPFKIISHIINKISIYQQQWVVKTFYL